MRLTKKHPACEGGCLSAHRETLCSLRQIDAAANFHFQILVHVSNFVGEDVSLNRASEVVHQTISHCINIVSVFHS